MTDIVGDGIDQNCDGQTERMLTEMVLPPLQVEVMTVTIIP